MSEPHFYVIWRDGGGPPTVKFTSLEAAKQSAQRLARNNLDARFHVLELVDTCQKSDVHWETGRLAGNVEEMPF